MKSKIKIFKTIKYRIIRTYVTFLLITISLILGGVYYFSGVSLKNMSKDNTLSTVDNFYKELTIKQKNLEIQGLPFREVKKQMEKQLMEEIKKEEGNKGVVIRVKTPKGYTLNHNYLRGMPSMNIQNKMVVVTPKEENDIFYKMDKSMSKNHKYIYINTTYNLLGDIYIVQFIVAMVEYEMFLDKLTSIYKIAIIMSILLAIIGGGTLSNRILKPLREINKIAQNIGSKNLNKRIPQLSDGDELAELITILNSMISRLEKSFDVQKKFVSDASHELRTPLLVINGYAELLEDWGLEDKEVSLEAVKNIKSEGNNMKKIIEDLLFLAREENGTLELNSEKIEVCEILEGLKNDYNLLGKKIEVKCEEIEILGDKKLFLQCLRAIIENSIKFSNDKIILSSKKVGDEIRISIQDFGVGIPEDKIDSIFDRFVKLDDHRNRNKGGNGLGLSIVSEIVKKHNWKIEVESRVDYGTKMTIVVGGDREDV